MFFFKEISGLLSEGLELNFTIKKSADKLVVSVLPKVKDLKDDAGKKIVPLVITGTPDELENGFSAAISSPIQKASGLLTNISQFEKATDQAAANSQALKKEAETKKKKFDQLVKKADDFEKDKKYNNAIGCLKQALEFATNKKPIETRIQKLEVSANSNSLFGEIGTEDVAKENYLDPISEDTTGNNSDDIDENDLEDNEEE